MVEVPDRSGGLASVLKVAHQAELNVEYMYAFVNKSGSNAVLIFRFDDMDRAIEILQQAGFTLLTGPQICAPVDTGTPPAALPPPAAGTDQPLHAIRGTA